MSHQKIALQFLLFGLSQHTVTVLFSEGVHPVNVYLVELQLQNGPSCFGSEARTVCFQDTTEDSRSTICSGHGVWAHKRLSEVIPPLIAA
jgi:hypothetical protein